MAKQILQLGMGDAFDDWLMEKIQLLRKGSVIASGIRRVEQVTFEAALLSRVFSKKNCINVYYCFLSLNLYYSIVLTLKV